MFWNRILLLFLTYSTLQAQSNQQADAALLYLHEFKSNAARIDTILWGIQIDAPILFLDTGNRLVYLSEGDGLDNEKKYRDSLWITDLTEELKVTTPTLNWQGKQWVVVPLPSKMEHKEVIEFMAHESFHCVQEQLRIKGTSPSLPHLSTEKGRLLIQAEIFELLEAFKQDSLPLARIHIKNALILRKYRYLQFPKASDLEGLLELNEGLAEYTGMVYANYSRKELIATYEHIAETMGSMQSEMVYPYTAGSLYAFINDRKDSHWRKLVPQSFVHEITERIYAVSLEGDVAQMAQEILDQPAYGQLKSNSATESAESLKKYFSKQRLTLPSAGSSMQFKSTLVISIPEEGTVYNSINITNPWGRLEVSEQGRILVSSEKNRFYLNAENLKIDKQQISGNGWKLILNEGFVVERVDGGWGVEEE